MSAAPKVTYSTIHRAEIEIPEALHPLYFSTKYGRRSARISSESNVASSGSDTYSSIYEWAEDSDQDAVVKWANLWLEFLNELRADNTEEKEENSDELQVHSES